MKNTSICGCGKSGQPCKCACECKPEQCCTLDCLERPNFFCGQLVTDQDFNKLVAWVDRKHALQRYLHGWGIVCGLQVILDPCDCAKIIVSSGYGIDCCGRDLVVCDPLHFSLKKLYCDDPKSPCDLLPPRPTETPTTPTGETYDFAGVSVPKEETVLIDVFLRYSEELSHPQRASVPGSCDSSSSACQHTRVRQVGEICTKRVSQVATPAPTTYLDKLKHLAASLGKVNNMADLKYYLETEHSREFGGLRHFPFIPYLSDHKKAWTWIFEDFFLSQSAACAECDDIPGIPLARALLWKNPQKKSCCVIDIETAPPRRRPLSKDSDDRIDYSAFLWRPVEEVRAQLNAAGVPAPRPFPTSEDVSATNAEYQTALWSAPAGSAVTALTLMLNGTERVAVFKR